MLPSNKAQKAFFSVSSASFDFALPCLFIKFLHTQFSALPFCNEFCTPFINKPKKKVISTLFPLLFTAKEIAVGYFAKQFLFLSFQLQTQINPLTDKESDFYCVGVKSSSSVFLFRKISRHRERYE